MNNYSNVPEETRRRVLEVIDKYKYVPHASARALAGIENKIIGLFMVDKKADTEGRKVSDSTYFSPFLSDVIDNANKKGFHVLVYAVGKPGDYRNVRNVFFNKTISGGIFIGQQNDSEIDDIIEGGYKTVLIDRFDTGEKFVRNSVIVNADNFDGAYRATSYLIGLGHRRIAHVTGYTGQLSTNERLEGYKKALQDGGLSFDGKYVAKGNFMRESGFSATRRLFEQCDPTAIFYASDSMAVGGMQAIQESGRKIPDDISIVGFDDIEITPYLQPPLTTVRLPIAAMSANAVNTLINAIQSGTNYFAHYVIPVEFVERNSCRRIGDDPRAGET